MPRKAGWKPSREWTSWNDMKSRCYNPNRKSYPKYGGRGVTVCKRWRKSFKAFLEDMGPRPLGKTLDRYPDFNGNYEPGNCRWATPEEQARNTRRNIWLTLNGERLTIGEWAKRLGISEFTLYYRSQHGWSDEKILTTTKREWNGTLRATKEFFDDQTHLGPFHVRDVMTALSLSVPEISSEGLRPVLTRLTQEGFLVRVGHGMYERAQEWGR